MQQKQNIVHGDMAGGNVIKTVNIAADPATFMRELRQWFEQERAANIAFQSVVDQLEYYQVPIDKAPVSLEQKLQLGGRDSEITKALRSKELFVKLMTKYSLSEAAQLTIAYCLGLIDQLFEAHVTPLINSGATKENIDAALVNAVIHPVLHTLEVNFLGITPQDIRGMVYYLTGNCFLWWHSPITNANISSSS